LKQIDDVEVNPGISATVAIHLPGNVGSGRQADAYGEPFRAKTWTRIRTYLAKPIGAEGLNGACQENDAEARGE
jgi:hypothetical protein